MTCDVDILLEQVASCMPDHFFLGNLALLPGDDHLPTIDASVGGLSQCLSFLDFFLLLFFVFLTSSTVTPPVGIPRPVLIVSNCATAVVVLLGLASANPVVALCTASTSDELSVLTPKLSMTVTVGICPPVLCNM